MYPPGCHIRVLRVLVLPSSINENYHPTIHPKAQSISPKPFLSNRCLSNTVAIASRGDTGALACESVIQ